MSGLHAQQISRSRLHALLLRSVLLKKETTTMSSLALPGTRERDSLKCISTQEPLIYCMTEMRQRTKQGLENGTPDRSKSRVRQHFTFHHGKKRRETRLPLSFMF
jgi:hypothetical protein